VAGIPAVSVPGVGGARRTAATGAGAASGPVMVEIVDDSQALGHVAWSGAPNRVTESLRRLWVIPVVIASIALGAVGGSVATRAAEKPPVSLAPVGQATTLPSNGSYTDTTVVTDPVVLDPPSNAVVADPVVPDSASAAAAIAKVYAWLNQPQRSVDKFPNPEALGGFGIDPNTTHFVTTEGTTSVWVARGTDRGLCLLMTTAVDGMIQDGCVPEAQFPRAGVSIGAADGTFVTWDPSGVSFGNSAPATG
jgi:hypothetical protein